MSIIFWTIHTLYDSCDITTWCGFDSQTLMKPLYNLIKISHFTNLKSLIKILILVGYLIKWALIGYFRIIILCYIEAYLTQACFFDSSKLIKQFRNFEQLLIRTPANHANRRDVRFLHCCSNTSNLVSSKTVSQWVLTFRDDSLERGYCIYCI